MTKHLDRHYRLKGILVLEIPIVMLLFYMVMVTVNNGIVRLVTQEWHNAADSAAFAAAEKFEATSGSGAVAAAITEAIAFATLHTQLGSFIQESQVNVSMGEREECVLGFDGSDFDDINAIRVEIVPPVDAEGNPSGITAVFGQISVPLFAQLPEKVTSIAVIKEESVYLLDYRGIGCTQ